MIWRLKFPPRQACATAADQGQPDFRLDGLGAATALCRPCQGGGGGMRKWIGVAAIGLWAASTSTLAAPAAKPPAKDQKVWAMAEAARPAQLQLLESLVNIDSGTGDVEGG